MEMNDYQNLAKETAIYPGQFTLQGLTYSVLGMVGEAGEVANRFKKVLRDDRGVLTEEATKDLISECGDTLWYLARICEELGTTLEKVAHYNLQKLHERAMRNAIRGGGNNR